MKKTTIAGLVGLLFTSSVFATSTTPVSSDEVVITASRITQPKESVIADVTVIDSEEIERAGQTTFIELLQTQPGVEIASNGGAGTTSSIYLRGTNANQVVVLIDGMRVGSATTGTTTFENIPLAQIEKIEILRGPATSLYGQDAIGGVIQIFTKKSEGAPQFNAAVGYGTYNTKNAEAGFRGSFDDTNFSLNTSSFDTDGFSALRTKYNIDGDADGYRNLAISGSISHQISSGNEIGIQFLSSEGHSNYDSGVNTFNNYVDLSQLSYSLFSKNQITSSWKSTVRAGEGIDDQKNQYSSTTSGRFKTNQQQLSWQNDIDLPIGTLTLLYDKLQQKVNSDTPYDKTKRNTDGYLVGYLASIGDHTIQANLRTDHSSQFGTNNTGGIGYGYKINPNWRITGSYGKAFKAPTFNDLYYAYEFGGVIFPFNNPNLKAEKSENFEGSLRYEDQQSSASATLFRNKINNFITLDQSFLPINVDAEIKGITLAGSQRWQEWQLKGSVDIESPKNTENDNLLTRRANRHASGNIGKSWGDWNFSTEVIGSSVRYNDANNQTRLSGYAIMNVLATYKINTDWSIQGRVNNLLDKDYALAYGTTAINDTAASISTPYNTPGANLFVSIRYSPSN
jgi:vitamin B12 transporter